MIPRTIVLLVAFLVLVTRPAAAQTTALVGPAGGNTSITLESASGGGAPFSHSDGLLPGVPARPSAVVNTNVGFTYLRPYWAGNGLSLRAPAGTNPAVGVVGPHGNLANNFGFLPRIDLQYDASALGFGLASSAQYLSLGGNLERTVTTAGGSADLIATSELAIVVVNLAEINKTFRAGDLFGDQLACRLGLEDDTYGFSLGTRFTSLRQSYHASLRGGPGGSAASDATQTFAGLGLTASVAADHPISRRWGVYSSTRGSLLLGPNNRKSATTGLDAGGAFDNTLVENKTALQPAGELEFGLRYLAPFNAQPAGAAGDGPVLSVRAGFVGQLYGGVGFLPAAPGTARFNDRPLYLVGFTLLAGVEF